MPGCSLRGEAFLTCLRLWSNMPGSSPMWNPFSLHLGSDTSCHVAPLCPEHSPYHIWDLTSCDGLLPHGCPPNYSWIATSQKGQPLNHHVDALLTRLRLWHPNLGCHSLLPCANRCSPNNFWNKLFRIGREEEGEKEKYLVFKNPIWNFCILSEAFFFF